MVTPCERRRRATSPQINLLSKSVRSRLGNPPASMAYNQKASAMVDPFKSVSPYTQVVLVLRQVNSKQYLYPPGEVPSPYPMSTPIVWFAVVIGEIFPPRGPRFILTQSPIESAGSSDSGISIPVPRWERIL